MDRRVTGCLLRSEEHTSELQSRLHLVCRLLLEKKKTQKIPPLLFQGALITPPARQPAHTYALEVAFTSCAQASMVIGNAHPTLDRSPIRRSPRACYTHYC